MNSPHSANRVPMEEEYRRLATVRYPLVRCSDEDDHDGDASSGPDVETLSWRDSTSFLNSSSMFLPTAEHLIKRRYGDEEEEEEEKEEGERGSHDCSPSAHGRSKRLLPTKKRGHRRRRVRLMVIRNAYTHDSAYTHKRKGFGQVLSALVAAKLWLWRKVGGGSADMLAGDGDIEGNSSWGKERGDGRYGSRQGRRSLDVLGDSNGSWVVVTLVRSNEAEA